MRPTKPNIRCGGILASVLVLVLFGVAFSYEVSWISGQSGPPDWSITPNSPTTSDVIHFSGPTETFSNSCVAEGNMGGTATLSIDQVNKTIELWFKGPPPTVCPFIWDPVCGLEGSFGPLEAGQWRFFCQHPDDSFSISFTVRAIRTAFTYQGRLIDANNPADGLYDLEFKLFDDLEAGTQQGSTNMLEDVDVIDGYFSLVLDFGSYVFNGDPRWLEIGVRSGDSTGGFTDLTPRQEMTPTPYALYAETAGISLSGDGGGLELPYYGITSTDGKAFRISNTYSGSGASYGGFFYAAGEESRGVFGQSNGSSGMGVKGWAQNSGDVQNYGGHFCSAGGRGIGVYGLAENTGNVENYGGKFLAEGTRGIGIYAKGGSDGYAGEFEGDVKISGTGNGIIFPDGSKQTTAGGGGCCFPQPEYDSGWIKMPLFSSHHSQELNHNLGGNIDNYVVDLQLRRSNIAGQLTITNRDLGSDWYYERLTTKSVWITGPAVVALDYEAWVRVRIWVY